jgi:hypothetical protein
MSARPPACWRFHGISAVLGGCAEGVAAAGVDPTVHRDGVRGHLFIGRLRGYRRGSSRCAAYRKKSASMKRSGRGRDSCDPERALIHAVRWAALPALCAPLACASAVSSAAGQGIPARTGGATRGAGPGRERALLGQGDRTLARAAARRRRRPGLVAPARRRRAARSWQQRWRHRLRLGRLRARVLVARRACRARARTGARANPRPRDLLTCASTRRTAPVLPRRWPFSPGARSPRTSSPRSSAQAAASAKHAPRSGLGLMEGLGGAHSLDRSGPSRTSSTP